MARNRNSDAVGRSFNPATVQAVWTKGRPIQGYPPDQWRYDHCGRPIAHASYGDTSSQYGWEVDHFRPVAKGGTDDLSNLQPLQWDLNRQKGDTFPWACPV